MKYIDAAAALYFSSLAEKTVSTKQIQEVLQNHTDNVATSVMDPCHFVTDPGSRIRTTDLRIRIWIQHFSSVAHKQPTKNICFQSYFCLLIFEGTFFQM